VAVFIGTHLVFRFRDFKDLSVADVGTAGDAEKNEDRREYAVKTQPLVQAAAHEKAENNAAGHGQAQLHDNGQVFGPIPVSLVIEQTAFPCRFIDRMGSVKADAAEPGPA